jgi:hypothetical protein
LCLCAPPLETRPDRLSGVDDEGAPELSGVPGVN